MTRPSCNDRKKLCRWPPRGLPWQGPRTSRRAQGTALPARVPGPALLYGRDQGAGSTEGLAKLPSGEGPEQQGILRLVSTPLLGAHPANFLPFAAAALLGDPGQEMPCHGGPWVSAGAKPGGAVSPSMSWPWVVLGGWENHSWIDSFEG